MVLEENRKDEMVREVTNKQVLERIGEKRTLLNNILRSKANWTGHILRNCLLHDAFEGQMTEVIGVGRRRIMKLLDDLKTEEDIGAKREG